MKNIEDNIRAALGGAYDNIDPLTADDIEHTVILCPVCNHKTLDNYAICKNCGWEYDGFSDDYYSAANGATLNEYRKAYHEIIQAFGGDKNEVLPL